MRDNIHHTHIHNNL